MIKLTALLATGLLSVLTSYRVRLLIFLLYLLFLLRKLFEHSLIFRHLLRLSLALDLTPDDFSLQLSLRFLRALNLCIDRRKLYDLVMLGGFSKLRNLYDVSPVSKSSIQLLLQAEPLDSCDHRRNLVLKKDSNELLLRLTLLLVNFNGIGHLKESRAQTQHFSCLCRTSDVPHGRLELGYDDLILCHHVDGLMMSQLLPITQ